MRWFWIDRFTEFRAGHSARAVKSVTLGEEHLDGYFPDYPIMSHSLIIEGFAQMGGLLVSQTQDFVRPVVLAKIARAQFQRLVQPGHTLHYEVQLDSAMDEGGRAECVSRLDGHIQGQASLYFVRLEEGEGPAQLFDPPGLLRMLRVFQMFEVGVDQDGQPLTIPPHLLEAERLELHIGLDNADMAKQMAKQPHHRGQPQ